MKKVIPTIIFSISLLFANGCVQNNKTTSTPSCCKAARSDAASFGLQLNNGEKWPVDNHTRQSAKKLSSLVSETASITSVKDAEILAAAIDAELMTLVQGCKMTGPSHDQLHVFLLAFFPKVAELKGQPNLQKLQSVRDDLQAQLGAYEKYFD